jgi:16S rRNA processing protein RimM
VSAKGGKLVTVGRVSGVHGVKGWLKIHSYTEPRGNVAGFPVWVVRRGEREQLLAVEEARAQGRSVVAKLAGIDDRDAALEWVGAQIAVERAQLPPSAPGEYYWTDLEGLEVRASDGEVLGTVDHLLATGSNDVLVIAGERQRLIPFVLGDVVRSVDLEAGLIVVDWPADFE